MHSVKMLQRFSSKIRASAHDAEQRKMTKRVQYHLHEDEVSGLPAATITGDRTHKVLSRLGYDFFPVGFDTAGNLGPIANRLLRAVTRTPHGRGSADSPFAYWRDRLGFIARVAAINTYIARSHLCIRAARSSSASNPMKPL